MPGKQCTGAVTNNSYHPRASKAFCEGVDHRAKGTAAAFPVTDNPHPVASESGVAWIAGWTVSDDAVGGNVSAADAGCCSVPQNTILA